MNASAALILLVLPAAAPPAADALAVSPAKVELSGKAGRQQLLVTLGTARRAVDRPRQATFRSATPSVVSVSPQGVVTPAGDGEGVVVASVGGREVRATVRVRDADRYKPATFERDVLPILTR